MLLRSSAIFAGLSLFAIFTISSFAKTADGKKENQSLSEKIQLLTDTTNKTRIVTINNEYMINIPKHLKECKDLNDEASMQYDDEGEEEYIIVIDESKADFLKAYVGTKEYDPALSIQQNYRKIQMARMKRSSKIKGKPVIEALTIDKLPAEIVDFDATVKGIGSKISYKAGFIEAPTKLYFVLTWTLSTYMAGNNQEMEDMIKSFRLAL